MTLTAGGRRSRRPDEAADELVSDAELLQEVKDAGGTLDVDDGRRAPASGPHAEW